MAPADIRSSNQPDPIETELRSIIETLYKIITQVGKHAGDATTTALDREVQALIQKYTTILRLASSHPQSNGHFSSSSVSTTSSNAPSGVTSLLIPPDVIEYVQEGRNPDIYTREFVELAMRNNQRLSGKMAAFGQFRDVLGREIVGAVPQLRGDVERVVVHTGGQLGREGDEGAGPGPRAAGSEVGEGVGQMDDVVGAGAVGEVEVKVEGG